MRLHMRWHCTRITRVSPPRVGCSPIFLGNRLKLADFLVNSLVTIAVRCFLKKRQQQIAALAPFLLIHPSNASAHARALREHPATLPAGHEQQDVAAVLSSA